jgi:hypothetical protein
VLAAADLNDTFGSKLDYPSGGADGNVLTKSGTAAAWAAASVAGFTLITTETFSAVSSISINNCFTSTYDNYLILLAITSQSTNPQVVSIRFRVSGADNSTSNYSRGEIFIDYTSNTVNGGAGNNQDNFPLGNQTAPVLSSVLLLGPNLSQKTGIQANVMGDTRHLASGGMFRATTVFDGFSIYVSGTITGNLSVYGYGK